MMLEIHDLTYDIKTRHGVRTLVNIPRLSIQKHQLTALIGPNGAGKTTLLHLLSGDTEPTTGRIELDGRNLQHYPIEHLAKKRAVLPQLQHIPFAISVMAILSMGLMPYGIHEQHPQGKALIAEVAESLQLSHLLDRTYQALSGGEQHRVQIGRVLVQSLFELETAGEDRLLLLDEPFNHLDLYHQKHLLKYFDCLRARKMTIVCVMHDLNQALHAADDCIILAKGELQGVYPAESLKDGAILGQVFQIPFIQLNNANHPNAHALSIFGGE